MSRRDLFRTFRVTPEENERISESARRLGFKHESTALRELAQIGCLMTPEIAEEIKSTSTHVDVPVTRALVNYAIYRVLEIAAHQAIYDRDDSPLPEFPTGTSGPLVGDALVQWLSSIIDLDMRHRKACELLSMPVQHIPPDDMAWLLRNKYVLTPEPDAAESPVAGNSAVR